MPRMSRANGPHHKLAQREVVPSRRPSSPRVLNLAEGKAGERELRSLLVNEIGLAWAPLNCLQYLSGKEAPAALTALPDEWQALERNKKDPCVPRSFPWSWSKTSAALGLQALRRQDSRAAGRAANRNGAQIAMDHFEGVVLDYLRADRALFVNSQCCIQLNEGANPDTSGPHWRRRRGQLQGAGGLPLRNHLRRTRAVAAGPSAGVGRAWPGVRAAWLGTRCAAGLECQALALCPRVPRAFNPPSAG